MKKARFKVFYDGVLTWEYDDFNTAILSIAAKYGAKTYNKMYDEGKIRIKGIVINVITK